MGHRVLYQGRPSAALLELMLGEQPEGFEAEFLESGDGYVNVLTVSDGSGDAMWSAERASGQASLLRLPLDSMGDGSRRAPSWWYRHLPPVSGSTLRAFSTRCRTTAATPRATVTSNHRRWVEWSECGMRQSLRTQRRSHRGRSGGACGLRRCASRRDRLDHPLSPP